jgi:hypothetical protein
MGGRATGVVHFRGLTPQNAGVASGFGRKLLDYVLEPVRAGRVRSNWATRTLEDGTVVSAAFTGNMSIVTIVSPRAASAAVEEVDVDLWIPRGFVLYPASNDAPRGWGLPIVQVTSDDHTPYDPINRAPGLDTARWTEDGALGQVLLSAVPTAGYPDEDDTIVPLIFHATVALHPEDDFAQPELGAVYAAYRIEFADFTAQSPDAGAAEQLAIETNKRVVFEAVNDHRVSIGRDPIALPIRGLYDGAQTAAEIMHASHTLGHFSATFPNPYQTAEDRLTKEGFRSYIPNGESDSRNHNHGENAIANALTATNIGTDPDGQPIYDIVPGGDINGADAFDGWLASPPHLAQIESTVFDKGFATTTVGFKHAFATQHFMHHTQWVSCGNRFWRSENAEIPVLSWFGFASLNLAWETWPVALDNSSPFTPPTDPFTILTPLRDSDDKLFWLRYHYANETDASLDFRNATVPALDGRIFMRGRAIAVVPHDGWVWAAAIQKLDDPDTAGASIYRLIALTHEDDDQDVDTKTNGMTAKLRLWYVDIPAGDFLSANPQSTIRSVYGDENEGFPWDQVNSPYSWRGGDVIDVGTSDGSAPDLLKYDAQWVFNASGTKAICLRSFGEYADYADLYFPASLGTVNEPTTLQSTALELTIGGDASGSPSHALNWYGVPAGSTAQPVDVGDPFGDWLYITNPIAAGYDANGLVSFCMNTWLVNPAATTVAMSRVDRAQFTFTSDYDFAPIVINAGITYSRSIYRGWADAMPFVDMASVLDVQDQVVFGFGVIQRFEFPSATDPQQINPAWVPCWDGTSSPIQRAVVWRAGDLLSDRAFANPDGTVFSLRALCYQVSAGGSYLWIGAQLPLSQNRVLLPSYAAADSDWVASYVMQPQPSVLFRIVTDSTNCEFFLDVDWGCSPTPSSTLTTLLEGDAGCRGGWMTSSFADESELADMIGITGASPRTLYARAV